MTEYIERSDALNLDFSVKLAPDKLKATMEGMALYADQIKLIPAADVAPVVHGRWAVLYEIWGKNVKTVAGYQCSKCGGFNYYQDNYCPNCGARMDEVEKL